MSNFDFKLVEIDKPDEMNFILGQSHFIKTVEDIYETIKNTVPTAKFGIAFCEASCDCKIRFDGNDEKLKKIATKNARKIAAGHSFLVFMEDCFPLNILNNIKNIPEVCHVFCATANPTKIVICESENKGLKGRGIVGVIDGFVPKGIENSNEKQWRHKFLREINYKL